MIRKIRKKPGSGSSYTVIDNNIFKGGTISLKAIGLYCLIRSLPEGWNFSAEGMAALVGDKAGSVRTGLKELETAGFVRFVPSREGGKYSGYDCLIYESPDAAKPDAAKPDAEKPNAEKPPQEINNKEIKKEEIKKEEKREMKKTNVPAWFGFDVPADRIIF